MHRVINFKYKFKCLINLHTIRLENFAKKQVFVCLLVLIFTYLLRVRERQEFIGETESDQVYITAHMYEDNPIGKPAVLYPFSPCTMEFSIMGVLGLNSQCQACWHWTLLLTLKCFYSLFKQSYHLCQWQPLICSLPAINLFIKYLFLFKETILRIIRIAVTFFNWNFKLKYQ